MNCDENSSVDELSTEIKRLEALLAVKSNKIPLHTNTLSKLTRRDRDEIEATGMVLRWPFQGDVVHVSVAGEIMTARWSGSAYVLKDE